MARITLQGEALYTDGALPRRGLQAPPFSLANSRMVDVGLDHFGRSRKVLNIVPSLDTPNCAQSARRIGELLRRHPDTILLQISADLPFAAQRVCAMLGLDGVVALSTFRSPLYARSYGVAITAGALRGLTARAVLVLDGGNTVLHAELVRELTAEPDYETVVEVLEAEYELRRSPAAADP